VTTVMIASRIFMSFLWGLVFGLILFGGG